MFHLFVTHQAGQACFVLHCYPGRGRPSVHLYRIHRRYRDRSYRFNSTAFGTEAGALLRQQEGSRADKGPVNSPISTERLCQNRSKREENERGGQNCSKGTTGLRRTVNHAAQPKSGYTRFISSYAFVQGRPPPVEWWTASKPNKTKQDRCHS